MNTIVKNEISDIMTKDIKNLLLEMRDFTHYPDTILSPFDLDNMEEGINLLMRHIAEDNNIFIQVDSDVDGLTSAALMYLAIKRIKSDAKITYRLHPDKTHGIKIG